MSKTPETTTPQELISDGEIKSWQEISKAMVEVENILAERLHDLALQAQKNKTIKTDTVQLPVDCDAEKGFFYDFDQSPQSNLRSATCINGNILGVTLDLNQSSDDSKLDGMAELYSEHILEAQLIIRRLRGQMRQISSSLAGLSDK